MRHAIRITGKLLLIVCMALPPSLGIGAPSICLANQECEKTCQGCGCCTVEETTQECPCCEKFIFRDSEKDDCRHGEAGGLSDDSPVVVMGGPFTRFVLEEGPVPDPRGQLCDKENSDEILTNGPRLLAYKIACNCRAESQPFGNPVPRSPVTEIRDLMAVSSGVTSDAAGLGDQRSPSIFASAAYLTTAPHFTQIAFCVWRM